MTDFMCECLKDWSEGGTYPKWIIIWSINKKGSIHLYCQVHNKGKWFQ